VTQPSQADPEPGLSSSALAPFEQREAWEPVPAPALTLPLRAALLRLRLRAGGALKRGRLPNAIVIGAAKGGTTSVYRWLSRHPDVCASRVKEVKYFNDHYDKGACWYAAHFVGDGRKSVRVEASPSYLWDPRLPERVRSLLPTPKLVVLLREPVDRAWSQYWMRVRHGWERLSFRDAIRREADRFGLAGPFPADGSVAATVYAHQSYLGKGVYAPQLERWLAAFPRSSFHFIRSEDLFRSPAAVLGELLRFLGLAPLALNDLLPQNAGRYPPLDAEFRHELDACFAASNRRVEQLTGISWPARPG
jgi:hypothetical protein